MDTFLIYISARVRNWGIQWELKHFHSNLLLEHFSTLMGALTTAGVTELLTVEKLERERRERCMITRL